MKTTILYETDEAIFNFPYDQFLSHAQRRQEETPSEELAEVLDSILSSEEDPVRIPEGQRQLGYVVLDLLGKHEGTVFCKACQETYRADQLKEIPIGHGSSPFSVDVKPVKKRWWQLWGRRVRMPGLRGGKGYECPRGDRVFGVVTWVT